MRVTAVIDRIEEGEIAVLEIEGEAGDFFWPVRFLPSGVHEGSVLDFTIEENPEEETRRREEISRIRKKLLDRPDPR